MPTQSTTGSPQGKGDLQHEYRCDLNFPTAHITIYAQDVTMVQDIVKRLEPRATFKPSGSHNTSLLVFNANDQHDPNEALGVISELDVPQSWTISRNQVHMQKAA